MKDIDAPKLKKTLPRYLTLDESISLLESVDGPNRERDLCILTLFLNCGLRISELIGLNLADIHDDALRVLGKGDKVRIVYLNQACQDTLADYLAVERSGLSLELGKMRREGLLDFHKSHFLLKTPETDNSLP